MAKTTVRNTSRGYRGLNTVDGYRELNPGETAEVELSADELASAKRVDYFEFGAAAKAAPAPAADESEALPRNAPKLKAIAKAEGIDVGDAKSVDDLTAAIEAGRATKAAGGIPPITPPADDLDKMSDADLRTTVAAVTGKPEADYADTERDELLTLARGK